MTINVAIIELGSNAIRTAEFAIEGDSFTELSLNRIAQRLLNPDNYIEAATMNIVIKVINDFKNSLTVDTEIYAIATAALRNANNQAEFVEKIQRETNITIEIIPAEKEAYYDYLAVNHKLGLRDVLIADIGGGSTEIITVQKDQLTNAVSIGWGGVNLSAKFFTDIPVPNNEQELASSYLQGKLNELDWLHNIQLPMVLLGGASIALFKTLSGNSFVPSNIVQSKIVDLRKLTIDELKQIKDIPAGTVDVLNGGMTMMDEIIKYAKPSEITTIKASVREGYLIEKIKNA